MSKLEAGKTYHIYNQGNSKESLFKEAGNYPYFLSKVEKYFTPFFDLYAYCLLNNHFHIVLKMKDDVDNHKATLAISNCFNAYAKAINKKYDRTGSLFRDRFRRKIIDNDEYLRTVIAYVSANGVHHGFKETIIEWPWSSFHDIASDTDTFLDKEFVIKLFNGKENYIKSTSQKDVTLEELE
ncbi:MAG: transposase [Nonlabens sp.]|nr:transposase [Nonlabens sp.]